MTQSNNAADNGACTFQSIYVISESESALTLCVSFLDIEQGRTISERGYGFYVFLVPMSNPVILSTVTMIPILSSEHIPIIYLLDIYSIFFLSIVKTILFNHILSTCSELLIMKGLHLRRALKSSCISETSEQRYRTGEESK